MNQRGFATLEVILMVMVIGILASIAIPRFTDITTQANTAKIQADLATIDTAISVYTMDGTNTALTTSSKISDLKDYLRDAENIKPPTGKCYINGDEKDIPANSKYAIASVGTGTDAELRAVLAIDGNKTAGDFTKFKSATE